MRIDKDLLDNFSKMSPSMRRNVRNLIICHMHKHINMICRDLDDNGAEFRSSQAGKEMQGWKEAAQAFMVCVREVFSDEA